MGSLILFLILEVKLSIFTSEHDVNCWFTIYSFYYIEVCCLYAHFVLRGFCLFVCFTINECWILLCLSFILLMWYIMLVDFWILNHPYIPGINPPWSWYMVLLMHCYIQFANILLRIIASMFIWDIRLQFSSFVVSLVLVLH